jgi:ParB family chromosome partitioning protein
MTSGDFRRVPIDQIRVPERIRTDHGKIPELADSIRRLGLIHPIVITRDFELFAGERRLRAFKLLNRDEIQVQYLDEVDERTKRAIELEENIKRKQLDWREETRGVAEHHNWGVANEPEWSEQNTADDIGMSQQWVSDHLVVHKEFEHDPEILELPKFSTAFDKTTRNRKRRDEAWLQGILGTKGKSKTIINADFCEWVKTYDGPKFNFLHCDFPYGIRADKRHQGSSVEVHGGFDDSPKLYFHLLEVLCDNLNKLCTDSAHIMFWFSMKHYEKTLKFFADNSDFKIDPFPLMWLKSDNMGFLPDRERGPRRIYETALFGSRGDRKIVGSVSNAIAEPTDRSEDHMSPKPERVLRHFFRMFVDENTAMLDPTCGSGTAIRAAEASRAKYVFGIESDKEYVERANIALEKSRLEAE